MAKLVVSYPSDAGTHFDAVYHVEKHLPLVEEKWAAYGLTGTTALLPDQPDPAHLAIAILSFDTRAGIDAALASPEASEVFGDLPNFTDIAPQPAFFREGSRRSDRAVEGCGSKSVLPD